MRYLTAVLLCAVATAAFARPVWAESAEARTVKILLTSLSFDRALVKRAVQGEIVIAVEGACPTAEVFRQVAGKRLRDFAIRVVAFETKGPARQLDDSRPGAVFVCADAGVSADLLAAANERAVLILTDGEAVVRAAEAAVGVEAGEGGVRLVVNASIARKQGADFDPRLYGAARVVD
jgi:hypothetical protein